MLRRLSKFLLLAFFLIVVVNPFSRALTQTRATKEFPLELDHVFIWVTKGAPEAASLEKAGLQLQPETYPHIGQGTASKIFLFENLYLELIWIEDEQAAAKNAARSGIDMLERARWRKSGASPFGVGLHRLQGVESQPPFPVKNYWAEWMQPNTVIDFAQSTSNMSEPMYFILPGYLSINSPGAPERLKETLRSNPHALGISRLTNLKIITTSKNLTATSTELLRGGVLKVERGKAALAELTFDGGKQAKSVDLRPTLPLVLKY